MAEVCNAGRKFRYKKTRENSGNLLGEYITNGPGHVAAVFSSLNQKFKVGYLWLLRLLKGLPSWLNSLGVHNGAQEDGPICNYRLRAKLAGEHTRNH